ncbi:MAG: sulfatase-like hydrolase/transferase [Planctomycetota bacterium]
MFRVCVLLIFICSPALRASAASPPTDSAGTASTRTAPPNVVYIMSDELAYYELSFMGNDKLRTPNIDKMAAEGIYFTDALAGAPVCAPLRCTLMTGKHMGHASVRANDGGTPLRAGEATIASMLKAKGYATGGFGKWGCGGRDSTGVPEDHGFDEFFGYYDQVHAHSFYTPYLVRNSEEVALKGNRGGRSGESYSHYEIMKRALEFIRTNRDRPFFCYLPITPPHGMYDIPAEDPAWDLYAGDKWMSDESVPQDAKNYAAMVSMVDRNVGDTLALLKELGLEDNTIVFFAGDNGGQDRFKCKEHPRGYFGPNVHPKTGVEFRGGKGNLYEGGLRIPSMVRWPGKIKPGRVSDLTFFQPDIFPTIAELVGAEPPDDLDGMSILPELLGPEVTGRDQPTHKHLYWEFGQQTAVRIGQMKGVRPRANMEWELYDLSSDRSEAINLAASKPEWIERMKRIAEASHEPPRPGKYLDPNRTRHERDRKAKWGDTKPPTKPRKSKNKVSSSDTVPADQVKLVRFSSQNTGNNRLARHAIDQDADTIWHSNFTGTVDQHPHELVLDLGSSRRITGFRYLARQDGGWNGAFAETEFYVSDSPSDFATVTAEATFDKLREVQTVSLSKPVRGRYVLIRVLREVNGKAWASAADIAVVSP